ncbi:MAG: M14-type cytosolic carboxypeptidase [Pseudomonadota bacterium]
MIRISSAFDGGNIHVVSLDNPQDIQLEIRKDAQSDFYQWFYFKLNAPVGAPVKLTLMNASGAAYVKGWDEYQAVISADRTTWRRTRTSYLFGRLTISFTPQSPVTYVAYFAPYTWERHNDLIASAAASGHFAHRVLGQTLDGRDLDCLSFGTPGEGKQICWLIGRQHPGESMAEWWMEGAIEMLRDTANPVSRALAQSCVIYLVPNMNPDGTFRGHLRTNAAGVNLNREWAKPTKKRSPEVKVVRDAMDETGVDICLDVHGDEALPYNFIAAFEGIPSLKQAQLDTLRYYLDTLEAISPDFQTRYGYPKTAAGKAHLGMATNHIAERFGAVAMTLEMPFKDTVDTPDETYGWSPERCKLLAHSCLHAIAMTVAADQG